MTDSSDGKALAPTPHMEFYEIAAFMFVFFRVANDSNKGEPFGSFIEQLSSLPADMPPPFTEFLKITTGIRDVVINGSPQQRDKYRALFNTAHHAVKAVLDALAADKLWDVCKTVEFDKLKDTVLLGIGGGSLQDTARPDYPKA